MLYQVTSLLIIISLVITVFNLQGKVKKLEEQQFQQFIKDKDLERQILDMNKNGNSTVEIIKFVRNKTNLGLVHAKKYVDNVIH